MKTALAIIGALFVAYVVTFLALVWRMGEVWDDDSYTG